MTAALWFIVGAWIGACFGAVVMAVLHAGADADRNAARFADVDRLAKQSARSARSARVWSNVPDEDEHVTHLGAA